MIQALTLAMPLSGVAWFAQRLPPVGSPWAELLTGSAPACGASPSSCQGIWSQPRGSASSSFSNCRFDITPPGTRLTVIEKLTDEPASRTGCNSLTGSPRQLLETQ